jgi:hypothetical protein
MINQFKYAFTTVNPQFNREIIISAGIAKPQKDNHNIEVKQYNALWDTGATNSVVTSKVVEDLGLIPIGFTKVNHAGGTNNVPVYLVNIALPNKIIIPNIRVSQCADQAGRFDIIIGMDIISLGDFSISGQGNRRMVSFCLPSMITLDYVDLANQHNEKLAEKLKPKQKED